MVHKSETRITMLDQILTEEQIKEVYAYLKSERTHVEGVEGLKRILRKYKKDLRKKGLLPDYLAYAIWYGAMGGK